MLPVCLRPDREAQGRALPKKCLQGKEDVHWPGDCLIFSTGRPRQGDINHGWRQQEGAGKTTVAQREDNIHYQSGRTFCDIRLPSESHARTQMKLIAFLKLHYFLEWLYILEISSFFIVYRTWLLTSRMVISLCNIFQQFKRHKKNGKRRMRKRGFTRRKR